MVITKYCPIQKIHLPLGPSLRVSFQTITGSMSSSPMSPNVISGVNCIFLTVNQNPRYLNSIKYYNFLYYIITENEYLLVFRLQYPIFRVNVPNLVVKSTLFKRDTAVYLSSVMFTALLIDSLRSSFCSKTPWLSGSNLETNIDTVPTRNSLML